MTGATINAILGLILLGPAAGAAVGAHFARKHGYQLGYRDGTHDLEDVKSDLEDIEGRFYTLSTQRRAA